MSEPVRTLQARIGWIVRFSEVVLADPPYLVMQSVPLLPGCRGGLGERGILWNVFELIATITQPGDWQVLDADCGYPPDAGLEQRVHVSHPDDGSIFWDIDIPAFRPALDETFDGVREGFVRLEFDRVEYESDICAMVRELKHLCSAPAAVDSLHDVGGLDELRRHFPDRASIEVGLLEPAVRGLELERLLEVAVERKNL